MQKNIESQLKSAGILTFIANDEPKEIGLVKVGIWVILEYQYDDAIQILRNPSHTVDKPLIEQDIRAMSKEMYTPYSRKAKRLIFFIGCVTVCVLTLCVFSYLVSA